MASSELVTVGWAYSVGEAALAEALLNGHGIVTFKHSCYTATVHWELTHALGGIGICVPAAQTDDAFAVLAGFEIVPRRKSVWRRLLIAVADVVVLCFVGFPAAPCGYVAARQRTAVSRYGPTPLASAV